MSGTHIESTTEAARLKVLHVIPSIARATGGPVEALIGFVNSLSDRAEVTVASTQEDLDADGREWFQSAIGDAKLETFSQRGKHTTSISGALFRWLNNHIADFDVVHIHALLHPISTTAAFIARRHKIPYVVRPLGTLSEYTLGTGKALLKRLYLATIERHTLAGARAIQFTAPMERDLASQHCDVSKGVLIANPVIDRPPGICDGAVTPYWLFMSRLSAKKRLDLAVQGFGRIAALEPQLDLVIAGSGDDQIARRAREFADRSGFGDRVRFAGFVSGEEKAQILANAYAYILPSEDENFGVAVAEAMQAGVAVVVSDRVGIGPDIDEYQAGIVTGRTVDEVSEAMSRLLTEPNLAQTMGINGQRLVRERYSPAAIGEQLHELYARIVETV
jgi:glycosyltransferase involved in cell wall biosynthesis